MTVDKTDTERIIGPAVCLGVLVVVSVIGLIMGSGQEEAMDTPAKTSLPIRQDTEAVDTPAKTLESIRQAMQSAFLEWVHGNTREGDRYYASALESMRALKDIHGYSADAGKQASSKILWEVYALFSLEERRVINRRMAEFNAANFE